MLLWGFLAYAASVVVLRGASKPSGYDEDKNPPPLPDIIPPPRDFRPLVGKALRCLNDPAALSKCELVRRLPGTLAGAGPGPLEQAQALRKVLISAIDHLKPSNEATRASAPEVLQYHIMYEEYVLGESTRYIMTRHSISESTFHRNRREAVAAVARHLESREELIVQGQRQP
jgi:hypothetical protein